MINDNSYFNLCNLISKEINISYKAINGYNCNVINSNYKNSIVAKSNFLSYLIILLAPFILIIFVLFRKNKMNKIYSDLVLDEWRDDTFEFYYEGIYHKLKNRIRIVKLFHKKEQSSNDNYIKNYDYIDNKLFIRLFFFFLLNPKIIYILFKIDIDKNINIYYVFIKFFVVYIKTYSLVENLNTKIFLSANDINSHLVKYELLKNKSIKFIVIQSSIRDKSLLYYKAADIVYCYSYTQSLLYKHSSNNFKELILSGSMKNNAFIKKYNKKYDVIFIEQYGGSDAVYGTRKNSKRLMQYILKFAEEYQDLKVLYRTRPEKRKQKRHVRYFDDILDKINNSKYLIVDGSGSSYEKVAQSRLCIGYSSTLCFEAIGLEVPTIFFYYDNYKYEVFDYENSDEDILVLDDSYEVFRGSILNALRRKDYNEYFKKYQSIYMNQDPDFIENVVEKIIGYV